jgi:cobalt/nickel transport system permease protein
MAMLCRGFDGEIRPMRPLRFRPVDGAFTLAWIGYFILARHFNLPQLLGNLIMGISR